MVQLIASFHDGAIVVGCLSLPLFAQNAPHSLHEPNRIGSANEQRTRLGRIKRKPNLIWFLCRKLVRWCTPRRLRHRVYILRGNFPKWGVRRTLRIALWESWYERKFGADTTLIISERNLDLPDDTRRLAFSHFPSWYLILHEALVESPVDCRDQVFIDYGCGLGRALLFASTLPFTRIIGIELSEMLCAKARENLEFYYRKAGKESPEYLVIAADASQFDLPDDVTIVYLFNPFGPELLRGVVGKIEESLQRKPRKCTVIYLNPWFEDEFLSRGFKPVLTASRDFHIFAAPSAGDLVPAAH